MLFDHINIHVTY